MSWDVKSEYSGWNLHESMKNEILKTFDSKEDALKYIKEWVDNADPVSPDFTAHEPWHFLTEDSITSSCCGWRQTIKIAEREK